MRNFCFSVLWLLCLQQWIGESTGAAEYLLKYRNPLMVVKMNLPEVRVIEHHLPG